METLVVIPQHQNQYYGKNSSQVLDRFGSPTGGFRDINCRFQARDGILSTPLKSCYIASVTKKTPSPRTPNPVGSLSEGDKHLKHNGKSKAIPMILKPGNLEKSFSDDLSYSELFAGPVYSNSPPPSSLPIPKFSLRQKRSVSLELPVRELGLKIHLVAKSAPSSPRGHSCPSPNSFMRNTASKDLTASDTKDSTASGNEDSTASATKDLRRMLNLNISGE